MLFGLAFFLSLLLASSLLLGWEGAKLKYGVTSIKQFIFLPLQRYKKFKQTFVEEFGFSGLFFDCLLPLTLAFGLSYMASLFSALKNLAIISGIINFQILAFLLFVFKEYLFNPRQIRRVKLVKLKQKFNLAGEGQARLFASIVITISLFAAFWINNALVLTNFYILSPNSFVFSSSSLTPKMSDWIYFAFLMMVNGNINFEVKSDYAQWIVMLISVSEFAFLGLFFSQLYETFRGQPQENADHIS